jgi:heterodisulfide reductase subunit C
MQSLYSQLCTDVRFVEGLSACMNCGVCTAICPAAEFYNYDPRKLLNQLQQKDDDAIEELLKSETIWYCGQCMSCKTRCPRGNTPGFVVQALRKLSVMKGYFVESEKGRQQFAIKRTIGENILKFGYCVHPEAVVPNMHPEQGPVWQWVYENATEVMERMGANYKKTGSGAMRKIAIEDLDELQHIFDVTGGTEMFECIEKYSEQQAAKMNLDFNDQTPNEYFFSVYTENSNNHNKIV